MAKILIKKEDGGKLSRIENRITRVENRASNAKSKAKSAFDMYNETSSKGETSAEYWENRAIGQTEKSERLSERAEMLKDKKAELTGEKTRNQKLAEEELKKGGKKKLQEKDSFIESSKELKFEAPGVKPPMKKEEMKSGGKKPVGSEGDSRFAKTINKMKSNDISEDAANAASIDRKKYGKSKFQEMAAAGKKKIGGKKC